MVITTQLKNIIKNFNDANLFELQVECLRDLLLNDFTIWSKEDMLCISAVFSQQLNNKNQEIILFTLASLLEPLIEDERYSKEISVIVRILLKSSKKSLKYAGLDIIAAGSKISSTANNLLKEAKVLLENEKPGYVLDYLNSLV